MIVIGDVHVKRSPDSPYNSGIYSLLEYILTTFLNHHLLFTGDFYDTQLIHNDVKARVQAILHTHKKDIYIVTGNHELVRFPELGNVLQSLAGGNIHVASKREDVTIDDQHVRLLPYLPRLSDMQAYEDIKETCDIAVVHAAYPGTNRGNPDEIKLRFKTNVVTVWGHIHEPFYYEDECGIHVGVGVPAPTRNGEQHHQPQVVEINGSTVDRTPLPRFFTIEDVKFGEQPKSRSNILNIIDAPSAQLAEEQYEGCHIRVGGIQLKVDRVADNKVLQTSVAAVVRGGLDEKFVAWAQQEEDIPPAACVACCVDALRLAADVQHTGIQQD